MAKKQFSLDGFISHQPGTSLGNDDIADNKTHQKNSIANDLKPIKPGSKFNKNDLDESLRLIENETDNPKNNNFSRRPNKVKSKINRRKLIKWFVILLVIGLLSFGAYLGYKVLSASGSVFKGNIFDLAQSQALKQDSNGRTNVLVIGTSEDDPGHEGAELTDSIMIISLDQTKKDAYMISVPRDLYVKYGQACNSGYEGKINEYYSCIKQGDSLENQREALSKTGSFVGNIFALDVQYGVNVNYTVMRELVNAVGGITVNIESRDPRGQMDSNFDWKCGVGDRNVNRAEILRRCPPSGHFIDFPNGPAYLDAERALYLAQARGSSAPSYGFEQSNFDREKNQQKILKAILEKATSVGTLSDINKVTSIIDAMGNNLRSTFETKELRTLFDLSKEIKSEDIKTISMIDGEPPLMTTGYAGGMSIVQPTAGLFDYSQIQAVIRKELSSDPAVKEAANIYILNGSGISGLAQTEADKLTSKGLNVISVGNAVGGPYNGVQIYMINDKPATKSLLEGIYETSIQASQPDFDIASGTDFVIIIGKP